MKRIFLFPFLFLLSSAVMGQDATNISLCCLRYNDGALHFSIKNTADSIVRVRFSNIEYYNGHDVVKYFKVVHHVVIIKILPALVNQISFSDKADITIDGEPYYPRKIKPHEELSLQINVPQKTYDKYKKLKLEFPDSSSLYVPLDSISNR